VISTRDLAKDLPLGSTIVHALRGVDMDIYAGEMVGIVGPSGSGKSTLLGLIGGLDTPTAGKVVIDGTDITKMKERALTTIRNEKIGFVFQFFNLIPTLTATENVALPIQFSKKGRVNPQKRAKELLDMLGLGDRLHHRPTQLSGGQQQRVALARALANNPALLLADEPTGSLDSTSTETVMQAMRDVQRELNTTIIIVTHSPDIAANVDRVITLVDGLIAEDTNPLASAELTAIKMLKEKRATGEWQSVHK